MNAQGGCQVAADVPGASVDTWAELKAHKYAEGCETGLGPVDKRDSQINWCLIQNRISSPDATLNQTPLGSPSMECLKS